ncbi:trimeric intracellular cation channel type B [Microcaecilia unicolor]|uniref:Trimeric intracellular cation channel type B n=1 Tax=Microcaecilia unicolor TaxID=1415580 RepID=A0A6P7X3L7_9AMPH|nr:trimeric intracellular cation channel type B [Microcaecilia unicolor]
MESLQQLSLRFSEISMFPFFDMAHYLSSVLSLREQPGAMEVALRSPIACWFSAMLCCFGGGILSSMLLAEPPAAFLANTTNVFLASACWYLIFYYPRNMFYKCCSFLPLRLMLAGMKEVTRTWKIVNGVLHANSRFSNAWIIMIAIGWVRGAGGGLISNFEQLVRGVWKPESNELLKMSYPVKVALIGAVLFTLQQTQHLPVSRHSLMLMYSTFLVVTKVTMMLTHSTTSPFAPFEAVLGRMLFGLEQASENIKSDTCTSSNGTGQASKPLIHECNDSPATSDAIERESSTVTRERQTKKAD